MNPIPYSDSNNSYMNSKCISNYKPKAFLGLFCYLALQCLKALLIVVLFKSNKLMKILRLTVELHMLISKHTQAKTELWSLISTVTPYPKDTDLNQQNSIMWY